MNRNHIRRPLSAFTFCGIPADQQKSTEHQCSACVAARESAVAKFGNTNRTVTARGDFLWSRNWAADNTIKDAA